MTQQQIEQIITENRQWINSVILKSKLISELSEKSELTSDDFIVSQKELEVAKKTSSRDLSPNTEGQEVTATAGQTVITLTRNAKTIDVYVDRVYQIKGVDYNHTEDTNTLTFTNGLDADSIVNIRLF
jgi:hypothetical protein